MDQGKIFNGGPTRSADLVVRRSLITAVQATAIAVILMAVMNVLARMVSKVMAFSALISMNAN